MSIGSTRKIGSSPSSSRVDGRLYASNNHTQFVENIDTTNNVLVRDENNGENGKKRQPFSSSQQKPTDFSSATPDISTSIEAIALSGIFDDTEENTPDNNKIGIYNNNQSIIKDEEIERTGRSYLKHFYEKNEHIIDVDELV